MSDLSRLIQLSFLLEGQGRIWADDLRLEPVGPDVPVTDLLEKDVSASILPQPRNLDFEAGTEGWTATGNDFDFLVAPDQDVKRSGAASIYFKPTVADPTGLMSWWQTFRADDYRNQRVRLTGYLRTESPSPTAALWMRVYDAQNRTLSLDKSGQREDGQDGWQQIEIILDVPENSQGIIIGANFFGADQTWVDDLKFEVAGEGTDTAD